MHVLELSYMYPSPRHPTSGVFIERQVRELARSVAVDVVSPVPWSPRALWALSRRWRAYGTQPATSLHEGIRVHHPRYLQLPGQWALPLAGVAMAAGARAVVERLAAAGGVDVIHAHNLLPEGLAAVLLGRRLQRPVVCALHGNAVTTVPDHHRGARPAARRVACEARAFTAVAPALLEPLRRLGPLGGPAVTIANGVDTLRFQPRDRSAARRRLGLAPDAPLVVYAGLLIARKGVDVLLAAFARLLRRLPAARLALVGGSLERDDRREALLRQSAALGCGTHVHFAGPRPHEEMPVWLAAADAVALASRLEGFPNVVREAIACGTPCVVTALPGVAEEIGTDCGIVVPTDDADAFAAALEQTLRTPWDRATLRRRALGWRWERNAEQTLRVLTDAVHPTREVA